MPRPNLGRSIDSEANLSRRLPHLRLERDLSYEALARLMAAEGCQINASAIFKIEKGTPRRKVTVDELVALAQVFDLSIENLLTPIELIEQERAHQILRDVGKADARLLEAVNDILGGYVDLVSLAATNPDLGEYALNLRFAPSGAYADSLQRESSASDHPDSSGGRVFVMDGVDWDDSHLVEQLLGFYRAIIDEASRAAESGPATEVDEK